MSQESELQRFRFRGNKLLDGALMRDNTDKDMLKDCLRVYKDLEVSGKRCIDLGSNVGGFSLMALRQGCAHVYAIEALPSNCDMIEKQLAGEDTARWQLSNAAIWSTPGEITFVLPESKRAACSAFVAESRTGRVRAGESIKVQTIPFSQLDPASEVLKIDVEGAEYEILKERLPKACRQVAIEWHLMNENQRELYHSTFVNRFDGWEVVFYKATHIFQAKTPSVIEAVYRSSEPDRYVHSV